MPQIQLATHAKLSPRRGTPPMTATAADSPSQRTEANRKNAQKSCGPRTQAGKDRSRFNALKHGMRAKLPLLPGEDPDALQARLVSWTAVCQPADDIDRYLVERAVNVSWQLDRADRTWEARLKRDLLDAGADQAAAIADEVLVLEDASSMTPAARPASTPRASPISATPRGSRTPARSTTPTSRPAWSTSWRARRRAAPGCWTAGTTCASC